MLTISKTPRRPFRRRRQADQLFQWVENALADPGANTQEFFAAVDHLSELLQPKSTLPRQDVSPRRSG